MNGSRSSPATYVIGRSTVADIKLDDPTVSRLHAELVRSSDGTWYLTDRRSSGGTYRMDAGSWIEIVQDFVRPGDRLRLGGYECTLDDLLRLIPAVPGAASGSVDDGARGGVPTVHDDRPKGDVVRDEYGQVVSKEDR